MKKKLLIFGAGKIAEVITYFYNRDSEYNIVGYVCDDAYKKSDSFNGKPLIEISKVASRYSAQNHYIFVAVGYQEMNNFRTSKFEFFKSLGYSFANYSSPFVRGNFTIGENSIVMDLAIIQPNVIIRNNVFVWSGAMIGHHAIIDDNCWLTGGCLVGGASTIGKGSFLGLGAMVGHEIQIGEKCMLGAGSLTTKSIGNGVVLITPATEPHRLNSEQFTKMSTCFKS
jgi:sugar O-acyltransferase (sialic acid O-acetyltransferase NeuD family)